MKYVEQPEPPKMMRLNNQGNDVGCYCRGHVCLTWFAKEAWRRLQLQVPIGEIVKTYWGGTPITMWEKK